MEEHECGPGCDEHPTPGWDSKPAGAGNADVITALEALCEKLEELIDKPQIQKTWICDETTDTHWLVCFEDGVEISRTDSGVSCDDPIPSDPEAVTECRDGTRWTVFYSIPSDGSGPVELAAINTGETCEPCKPSELWGRRVDTIEVDNHTVGEPRPVGPGFVPHPNWDQKWTVGLSNGQTHTCLFDGWDGSQAAPNVANAWAYINTSISECLASATGKPIKTQANGNAYGVRGPDGDEGTAWGAFGWVDCCPGDLAPVSFQVEILSGKLAGTVVDLPVRFVQGEIEKFRRCGCCGDTPTWFNDAGDEVEAPEGCLFKDCIIPAAAQIPENDPVCTFSTPTSVCEAAPGDPATLVQSGIFLQWITCGTDVKPYAFTLDADQEQVPHEFADPANYYAPCDNLDAPIDPPVVEEETTLDDLVVCCHESVTAEYSNSDNTTDFDVSNSGDAMTIKIGNTGDDPDGDDGPVEQLIEECLLAGGTVDIEWTLIPAQAGGPVGYGSGTLTGILSGSFAAGQFNATGDLTWNGGTTPGELGQLGKVATLKATCHDGDCELSLRTKGCNDDRRDDTLQAILDAQLETNTLLAQLIKCLCEPCEACVPTCAWGAGGIAVDNVWQPSESGMTWTLCGAQYTVPAGEYTNDQMAAWIGANTPHTMTVIPDPANPEKQVIIYVSVPCDCAAPTFVFGDDEPVTLAALPDFDVACDDDGGGDDDGPIGDQTICTTEKLGADFTSDAPGQGTHTAGSLFTGSAPLDAWSGTFTVTDQLGGVHTFTDGATVNGMAVGSTQSVTFTGTIEFTKDGEQFRCPVTDKAISANFTVEP